MFTHGSHKMILNWCNFNKPPWWCNSWYACLQSSRS